MKLMFVVLSLAALLAGCSTAEQPGGSPDQGKERMERPTPRPTSPVY